MRYGVVLLVESLLLAGRHLIPMYITLFLLKGRALESSLPCVNFMLPLPRTYAYCVV